MHSPYLPLPPMSRPIRLGQPYHGLLKDGVLTLSTGAKIRFGGDPQGDCYKFVVPGVSLSMTPVEVASEAAQGREWRSYALLSGRARSYAGVDVGADAWLYADAAGQVWRIRCPQLNTASLRPDMATLDEEGLHAYYPAALNFTFEITRFGLVSVDQTAVASTRTITLAGVALWAHAHKSDRISHYPDYVPESQRMFPGDGYEFQYCPLNIDDVSSNGARCLICCNRSAEQGPRRLGGGHGRAYPLSWLEVTVSGAGPAISITMARVRDQLMSGLHSSSLDWPVSTWSVSWGGNDYSGPHRAAGTGVSTVAAGRCAGGYYDHNDALQWVIAGVSRSELSASASVQFRAEMVAGFEMLPAYVGYYSATAMLSFMVTTSCTMGPHSYSPAPLTGSGSGNLAINGEVLAGSPAEAVPFDETSYYQSSVTSVVGTETHAGSGWSAFFLGAPHIARVDYGCGDVFSLTPAAVTEFPSIAKGVQLRELDGVSLVRCTNKVYAVVASSDGENGTKAGNAVLAIGSPDGWTIINDITDRDCLSSYNPGTRELQYNATFAYGWV